MNTMGDTRRSATILQMSFLTLSNANIQFAKEEKTWKSSTAKKFPPITKIVKLINKKEFAKAALDENIEVFVMNISSLSLGSKITIHPAQKAQIALLLGGKVTVPAKYLDFTDLFLKHSANVLSKHTKIDEHAIKLEDGKQPLYRLIYSLGLVKLETLKTYIKTNLANGFIQPSKFPVCGLILFICKSNGGLRLCINYQS